MNLHKHETVHYRTEDKLHKLVNTRLYKRHDPIYLDDECSFYEIVSKKKVINDKVPIETAFFILGTR